MSFIVVLQMLVMVFSWIPLGTTSDKNSKASLIYVPGEVSFAGEPVPLEDQEIRERLEKELVQMAYKHSSTILTLKRARRWQKQVLGILKEKGIPEDFYYLAAIESEFDPYANSGKAEGFWQFRPNTAIEEGLEVDTMANITQRQVDQRRDVLKSTYAFCKLIQKNYNRLKSWSLAAAAYNAGSTAIQEMKNQQKATSYYDLYLSPETYRYVFRLIAMKLIMQDPAKYGFVVAETEFYQPLKSKTIAVSSSIDNLVDFARQQGISYRTLKYYNPWLVFRPNNYRFDVKAGKTYQFEIPTKE